MKNYSQLKSKCDLDDLLINARKLIEIHGKQYVIECIKSAMKNFIASNNNKYTEETALQILRILTDNDDKN